jgi:hypothetical protein
MFENFLQPAELDECFQLHAQLSLHIISSPHLTDRFGLPVLEYYSLIDKESLSFCNANTVSISRGAQAHNASYQGQGMP